LYGFIPVLIFLETWFTETAGFFLFAVRKSLLSIAMFFGSKDYMTRNLHKSLAGSKFRVQGLKFSAPEPGTMNPEV
jgi:hypothetical protein